MSDIAIQVENLSKSFLVGHNRTQRERYTAMRDVIARNVQQVVRATRSMIAGRPVISGDNVEEFWALKHIDFEIEQGERIGIIGRNGAGKSTLLKILSRITDPTTGRVRIRGRVASLLEVGTGFHPELSGRENIFLNGAILGMTRREIQRKFDEIVAFAEVERFLDTPVKRYSSGMYVRLAFSVAAHLEPDILVVDEVLAVGDASFQQKCLGKMDEVASQGRTVLFVSHNMATISNLCQRGLVLNAGKLEFAGAISEAVIRYHQQSREARTTESNPFKSDLAELIGCEILGADAANQVTIHDAITISMAYRIAQDTGGKCVPNFHFFTADGICAFVSNAPDIRRVSAGNYLANCHIPGNFLNEGTYFVGVALTTYPGNGTFNVEFFDMNALAFNVVDPMDDRSNRYDYVAPMVGVVRPNLMWTVGAHQP